MTTDESKWCPWCFPCYFFMFLAFFISVKYVFIFFFHTSFEPEFIFHLTPFYLLAGLDNVQLLFLSLVILIYDAYLHYHSTKKNLLLSFIPTVILILGVGITITSKSIILDNIIYYIIFFCLILVLLIDQRHILEYSYYIDQVDDSLTKDLIDSKKPVYQVTTKKSPSIKISKPLYSMIPELEDKKFFTSDLSQDQIKKASDLFGKLEQREEKIRKLEQEIEYRRRILVNDEKQLSDNLSELTGFKSLSPSFFKSKELVDKINKDLHEENISFDFFENINESAFIVQQGRIKKINKFFSDILGYNDVDIVGKNFLDLIIPKDYSKLQKYYLQRLNGKPISSYEARFKTKDDKEILVHVDLKQTFLNGKKAEVAIVKKIDNKKE